MRISPYRPIATCPTMRFSASPSPKADEPDNANDIHSKRWLNWLMGQKNAHVRHRNLATLSLVGALVNVIPMGIGFAINSPTCQRSTIAAMVVFILSFGFNGIMAIKNNPKNATPPWYVQKGWGRREQPPEDTTD